MKISEKRRNQGFSLVELIVVTAIIAVLSVTAVSGIALISGWEMKKCVKELDAAIGETQLNAMSRGAGSLEIIRDASGICYMQRRAGLGEKEQVEQKTKLCSERIAISYLDDKGSTVTLDSTHPLVISFDAASGAYKPIDEADGIYCRKVFFKMGKRESSIKLSKNTGKHEIE